MRNDCGSAQSTPCFTREASISVREVDDSERLLLAGRAEVDPLRIDFGAGAWVSSVGLTVARRLVCASFSMTISDRPASDRMSGVNPPDLRIPST
jgi:hypothetical protein